MIVTRVCSSTATLSVTWPHWLLWMGISADMNGDDGIIRRAIGGRLENRRWDARAHTTPVPTLTKRLAQARQTLSPLAEPISAAQAREHRACFREVHKFLHSKPIFKKSPQNGRCDSRVRARLSWQADTHRRWCRRRSRARSPSWAPPRHRRTPGRHQQHPAWRSSRHCCAVSHRPSSCCGFGSISLLD